MPGEQLLARVDQDGGVVYGGRGFAEADRYQADLAVVVRDVAGREDPRHAGGHGRVDREVAVGGDVDSPVADRPEVGGEAERRDHRLRGPGMAGAVRGGDLDAAYPVAAGDGGDLRAGDHLDRRGVQVGHRALVGAEGAAPVDQRDRTRDRFQAQRPVAGAVPAAHHDDVLAGVGGQLGDEVGDPAPDPVPPGGQRPRGERADAAADDHRPAADAGPGVGAHLDGPVTVPGKVTGAFPQQVDGIGAAGLLDQAADQVAAADGGEPGHVVDGLLRVHGRHLAAGFG